MKPQYLLLIVVLILLIVILFLLVTLPSQSLQQQKIPQETGIIAVSFCPIQNCTNLLLSDLDDTSQCAIFEMSDFVRTELEQKSVDLLVHYENYEGYGTKVYARGLMHNKFCITNTTVITGSFNPSVAGDLYNDNNLISITSGFLADNYRNEFLNLKYKKNNPTPHPKILFNNYTIENYFCPRDHCTEQVLRTLAVANSSIYFMLFSFTDDAIGNLLIQKNNQLDIKGVLEKSQNSTYNEYAKLKAAGVAVTWDSNPNLLHHKVFIIDNTTVITGSYNPSKNADINNFENIIIFHDPAIAQTYMKEFDRLWQH